MFSLELALPSGEAPACFKCSLAVSAVFSFVPVLVHRGLPGVSPLTDPAVQISRSGFFRLTSLCSPKNA